LPPHGYSQHEVTESFITFPGFEVFEDMVRKLFASSKVLELDFGVLLQLAPKGSHLADGLDETISQRGAAAVQRLDLALVRHKMLYYRWR
jgi:predicted naringenin-chalcone synthase